MRKLVENMMMVCAPKAHIEQLAGQITKFRLLDDHIETANMFTEEARHPVKLKGFDLEFHELRVHFQSLQIPVGAYQALDEDPEVVSFHAMYYDPNSEQVGDWREGIHTPGDALCEGYEIVDTFNDCYTIGLPSEAIGGTTPYAVVRSKLGLTFEPSSQNVKDYGE